MKSRRPSPSSRGSDSSRSDAARSDSARSDSARSDAVRDADAPVVRVRRPSPPVARRSLSHLGGPVDTEGPAEDTARLAHALAVESAPALRPTERGADTETRVDDEDRQHVHGFHTYPARMHPLTARRLVEAFTPEGGTVLDPFCGSGTVLVEAMLAGRNAVGTDLNPLAVELARAKIRPRSEAMLGALGPAARRVAAVAEERRKARAGASRRYPPEDVEVFEPHVLLELDGLRVGIEGEADLTVTADLALVLSSILVKVSKKRGDTGTGTEARRIAAGYPSRLFVKKTDELVRRLRDFHGRLPAPPPRGVVRLDDAAELETVPPSSVDAILTSPPYVATYDYLAHHELRLRWLGLDAERFARGELGARRRFNALAPGEARDRWIDELASCLGAAARVLKPGGVVVMLIADSAVGREALRADDLVLEASRGLPLAPWARASQERPHFHGPTSRVFAARPRREHALLLRRTSAG